jgi:hypothetical protein
MNCPICGAWIVDDHCLVCGYKENKMKAITVDKKSALEIVKKNYAEHRNIFIEACEGYKKKATELLEQRLKEIKNSNGRPPQVFIQLQEPSDHSRDYERIIKMFEMSIDDTIELDEHAFAQYIMDDWSWKRQFMFSNSAYSATADTISKSMGSE